MARAVLETQKLTMNFGGVNALESVNFSLQPGELRCLIGPDGAGKSTFFKCLTGMLRPSSGEIFLRNEDITHTPSHRIASLGVGVKTQTPAVFDSLSVHENLWISARRTHHHRAANQQVKATLERLELGDLSAKIVGQLAHGQRQMVELGVVLVQDPWLILLDEPAAGMTGLQVEKMKNVIHEIHQNAALIVIEHDMHFIRAIARYVTVFHQGRIFLEGEAEDVFANPQLHAIYLGQQEKVG